MRIMREIRGYMIDCGKVGILVRMRGIVVSLIIKDEIVIFVSNSIKWMIY